MANSPQALKRARQAEKRRTHNASMRSNMRTSIKKVIQAIEAGDKEQATSLYVEMTSVVDSMSGKGLIHRNKVARHKSRLNAKIKAMG